jgi:hypothetical protein
MGGYSRTRSSCQTTWHIRWKRTILSAYPAGNCASYSVSCRPIKFPQTPQGNPIPGPAHSRVSASRGSSPLRSFSWAFWRRASSSLSNAR